ncbi:AraC-like DNA-binding protein [Microbacterium resistens]|uniref:AraC-like DNA-binding protein n=1 Tax=Microbacterium resistens TaxID=156977 RepID=A0ABU1SAY2_9MICO|nr:helix-turn-helix domain-containing protein [Microbacterium resistens]MDR6866418.1 AraC-like DNA-binding protein [Microbacterium resistens]
MPERVFATIRDRRFLLQPESASDDADGPPAGRATILATLRVPDLGPLIAQPRGWLGFVALAAGRMDIVQGTRVLGSIGPSEAGYIAGIGRPTDPFLRWDGAVAGTVLVVPLPRLVSSVRRLDADWGVIDPRDQSLLPHVVALLQALTDSPAILDSGPGGHLERLCVEAVSTLLLERRGSLASTTPPPLATTYEAAMAVLDAQAPELAFGIAELADEIGVSPRTLQRAFRDNGTTPVEALRARRVENAVRLLRDPESRSLTNAEVAQRAGFETASGMYRAFVKAGLPTPREYRRTRSSR